MHINLNVCYHNTNQVLQDENCNNIEPHAINKKNHYCVCVVVIIKKNH